MVNLNYGATVDEHYEAFRTEVLKNDSFKSMSRSSRIPTGRLLDNMGASTIVGDSLQPITTDIKYVAADYDFLSTFDIKLAAGRYFDRSYGTDTASYVLNEAAARAIGWNNPADAIGKGFQYGGAKGRIVGVVRDFHFESMHQRIVPIVLLMFPPRIQAYNALSIKISGNSGALAVLENSWKKFYPDTPFDYSFLQDSFDKLYAAEQRQATLFTAFACVAIFIACLGLFGLSAFAISQRVKEIGVRKVLGANVQNIVTLLSKDFLKLVAVAALMAFPIAWWAMNNWLRDFAYRINIAWWVFLVAGIAAALIAFITVSFQAVKAAISNPVNSLRSE